MSSRQSAVVAEAAVREELWRKAVSELLSRDGLLAAIDEQRIVGRVMEDWRSIFYALLDDPWRCAEWAGGHQPTSQTEGTSNSHGLNPSERAILLFLAESVSQAASNGLPDGPSAPLSVEVVSSLETAGRVFGVLESPDQESILAVLRDSVWSIPVAEVERIPRRSVRIASRYSGFPADSPVVERLLWLNQLYGERLTLGLGELVGRVTAGMWSYLPRCEESETILSELVDVSLTDGPSVAAVGRFRRLIQLVLDLSASQPRRRENPEVLTWSAEGEPYLTIVRRFSDPSLVS